MNNIHNPSVVSNDENKEIDDQLELAFRQQEQIQNFSEISSLGLYFHVYEKAFQKIILPYFIITNSIWENEPIQTVLDLDKAITINTNDIDKHVKLSNLYIKLAFGALCCECNDHAQQFIERARSSLREIFTEQNNYYVACALAGMIVYCFHSGERDKVPPYESLLRNMCENLLSLNLDATGKMNILDLKVTDLVIQSNFTLNYSKEETIKRRMKIIRDLKYIGTPHAIISAAKLYAEEILYYGSTVEEFQRAIVEIQDADQFLALLNKNNSTPIKNIHTRATFKGQLSALFLTLGNQELATQCANDVTILFAQQIELQEGLCLYWQLKAIEWAAKVHYITKSSHMLKIDIGLLERTKGIQSQCCLKLVEGLKTRYALLKQDP